MNFDPKRRRLIFALALVELAVIGTMITAVTWRSGRSGPSAAMAAEGGVKHPPSTRNAVSVGADPHVRIEAENFSLEIVVGKDGEVAFEDLSQHTGVIRTGKRTIELSQTDDGAALAASENGSMSLGLSEHRIRVRVPKATNLEITDCVSASVVDLGGEVHVTAKRGGVDLKHLSSAVIEIEANNGTVAAENIKTESLTIHSSNGRVVAQRIAVAGDEPKLDLNASNARIEFTGRLAPSGTYSMEASNGSVSVGLPRNSDTTVTASASNGSVRADDGIVLHDDGDNKVATLGAGSGALTVTASNGSITLSHASGV
jgi:hypothetical protein